MRYRFLASFLIVASLLAIPAMVLAATYTINVPVQLTNVAVPAGTKLQVACVTYTTPTAGDLYVNNPQGIGITNTPALDATGSFPATTVTIKIVTTVAMQSYRCGLIPPANLGVNIKQLLPNSDPQGVSGTFP